MYQPRALRAVAASLLPGLRDVVDFTLSTRVPVRVALLRRVRRSPGVYAGSPHTVRAAAPAPLASIALPA